MKDDEQEDAMVKAGLKNVKGSDIEEGDYEAFFQKAMKNLELNHLLIYLMMKRKSSLIM